MKLVYYYDYYDEKKKKKNWLKAISIRAIVYLMKLINIKKQQENAKKSAKV